MARCCVLLATDQTAGRISTKLGVNNVLLVKTTITFPHARGVNCSGSSGGKTIGGNFKCLRLTYLFKINVILFNLDIIFINGQMPCFVSYRGTNWRGGSGPNSAGGMPYGYQQTYPFLWPGGHLLDNYFGVCPHPVGNTP